MKLNGGGRILFVSSQAGQCGIFGFSAYSPSKFAVVGLAQVLRMELAPHNIRICVAYPPDTDTPGYAEENISKPEETKLISASSGLFKPEQVASDIISGMVSGDFSIYTGLDGWMLANLTAGMTPASSLAEGIIQVLVASALRMISLFYVSYFDSIVLNCKTKHDGTKKKD
jgi:3-dehydrosphinganine reductase